MIFLYVNVFFNEVKEGFKVTGRGSASFLSRRVLAPVSAILPRNELAPKGQNRWVKAKWYFP